MGDLMIQRAPPPAIEQLRKLQLMRTQLVSLLDSKSFADAVRGCFVRVLLQMHTERGTDPGASSQDNYYVAAVKGARRGPQYSGFSCDGHSTDWHIEIELPPIFRATNNGNVLQLNSISNTAFKKNEYDTWISNAKQNNIALITNAQLELRYELLQNELRHINAFATVRKNAAKGGVNNTNNTAFDEEFKKVVAELEPSVRESVLLLPTAERLATLPVQPLEEIEQKCLDFMSAIRVRINERTKCCLCKSQLSNVVLLPCKHRCICTNCMPVVQSCPAPGCGKYIQQKFDVYSA